MNLTFYRADGYAFDKLFLEYKEKYSRRSRHKHAHGAAYMRGIRAAADNKPFVYPVRQRIKLLGARKIYHRAVKVPFPAQFSYFNIYFDNLARKMV